MKNTAIRSLICAGVMLGSLLPVVSHAQETLETKPQRDARLAWWREARFGMFIHWGPYSILGGVYKGHTQQKGGAEWIMNRCKIPVAEYQQIASTFNPVKFDAEAWVLLAKEAGMKYIIITSKHHDGFAMFKSSASPFNIVDATPFDRDVLAELAKACRKHGVKLGFYYSQAQDWNNPGGAAARKVMAEGWPNPDAAKIDAFTAANEGHWDPAQMTRTMDEYIDQVAVPQVKELLSNYGEFPAVLWWDTPVKMNVERAQKLHDVVQALKPGIITNNRLLKKGGAIFQGDTETPENQIPAQGFPGRDWETCMTMNGSWGFKQGDDNWKSTELLIRNLCDIASKGGNYLLNVGPTSEGLIPQPSIDRLKEIGAWMKVNGEAIYGSSATPFGGESGKATTVSSDKDWRCTTKPGKLYLMIFQWPTNGTFELAGLKSKVTHAYLLAGHGKLKFNQTAAGVSIALPESAPDKIASVVCLEIQDAVARVQAARQ